MNCFTIRKLSSSFDNSIPRDKIKRIRDYHYDRRNYRRLAFFYKIKMMVPNYLKLLIPYQRHRNNIPTRTNKFQSSFSSLRE